MTAVTATSNEPRASLLLYHRDGAKAVPLTRDVPVVVGRVWPADVVVADPSLSRQHARFTWTQEGVLVEDLGSTNGTRLRGERVQKAVIRQGDDAALGSVAVAVHMLSREDVELAGMDSHERFVDALEEDLVRAKTFSRNHAMLLVRTATRGASHASKYYPRIRKHLRAVDHVAPYGPDALLVSLAETSLATASDLAAQLVVPGEPTDPPLVVGVAAFPETAASGDELLESARRAAQRATAQSPVSVAPSMSEASPSLEAGGVVVASAAMRAVHATIQRVARAHIPVLIQGETGTGKELVARAIHEASPRREKPMKSVNCAAMPATLLESLLFGHEKGAFTGADRQQKGLFEQANGGTLFLDEVGELSAAAQAALLRVLETKRMTRIGSGQEIEVDVRVVAATHRDLDAMAAAGTFRLDLVYRLNTMVIELPPLRDRTEEIVPLAEAFLRDANSRNGTHVRTIAPESLELLRKYRWPGNVRELRNAIERAVVVALGDTVTPDDLPERVRKSAIDAAAQSVLAAAAPGPLPQSVPPPATRPPGEETAAVDFKERMKRYETELLVSALRQADWNQTEAARRLGMPLRTLVHKMKQLGIRKTYEG